MNNCLQCEHFALKKSAIPGFGSCDQEKPWKFKSVHSWCERFKQATLETVDRREKFLVRGSNASR